MMDRGKNFKKKNQLRIKYIHISFLGLSAD